MEKDNQTPQNCKDLKQSKPATRRKKEAVLSNGCDSGEFSYNAHANSNRQNEIVNGFGCMASGSQCNGNDSHEEGYHCKRQAQEIGSCENGDRRRNQKELKVNVNGLDVILNGTGYSRNVCNVYRHENDIIFGRTRGGIVNNEENVGVGSHNSTERSKCVSSATTNGHIEDCLEMPGEHINGRTSHVLTAPLAMPESFSDDETSFDNDHHRVASEAFNSGSLEINSHSNQPGDMPVVNLPAAINGSHLNRLENDVLNGSVSSDSLNCDDFEQELIDEEEEEAKQNGAQDGKVSDNELEQLVENVKLQDNPVEEVENNVLGIEQTEVDSNDDAGDFIEADLPPNVERFAFFSRDSTSDEDEGCGDEVLPNNDEDIVSDNETIDPTGGDYVSSNRQNEHKVLNSELSVSGASNVLSALSGSVRGEMANLYPCNISCDKSNEENDDSVSSLDCRCLENSDVMECSSCNSLSHTRNSSVGDRDSNTGNLNNLCACCDNPMDVDSEHEHELGVNVCDKCFKELNAEQSRFLDNGAKHKTWPGSRSSWSSNYLNRNCGGLFMSFNRNSEKVNNNSFTYARFSSSDSDPYDRLYVSDSSEISPDIEVVSESVFQSSSFNGSDGTVVQSNQSNEDSGRSDGRQLHRQSISLDFNSPDKVLYYPYYTRRSRSLDQDLVHQGDHFQSVDRSMESEESNIAISNTNFQDDALNTQQKVFEKQAYSVPMSSCNVPVPLASCSSSDEEENVRMPGLIVDDLTGMNVFDNDSFEMVQSDLVLANDNMLYGANRKEKHSRGQKMRLDESEPIYEDIDQLELLLEEGERKAGTNQHSSQQPLSTAITKLRRKRRTRSPVSDVEKVMIWNEYEAYVVQVKQIGTSACGPTAVLNVLKAFDFQVDKEEVAHTIRSNLRMEAAPVPYYLFSRYNAGTTAQDLVDGVTAVTRGAIRGRFFHFYPPREIQLLKWLGHWMKKGAVPIATLNLQRGVKPGWTIPDAWHHQMVYGVSSKGVYLTNPLEIVPENTIMEQLTSDSVLLVRHQDVVGRFRDWCPLNEIIKQQDPRWRTMNVLGQIVHMLREVYVPPDQAFISKGQVTSSHISIPAAYKAGIILFMRANCQGIEELLEAPELPVKQQPDS